MATRASTCQNGYFQKCARLAKFAKFANLFCSDLQNSPTFANLFCLDLPNLPTFASGFARTRQTCKRQIWRVLCEFGEFGKSGELGEFGECRLDHFMHIKYVICASNDLSYHGEYLACTCKTRRLSPTCFARTRQTR